METIDRETARASAWEYLQNRRFAGEIELVIVDEATREKSYGWVFFYTSKKYLETRDMRYILVGNAPILVERQGGTVLVLGTAYPVDRYLTEYEKAQAK